LMHTLPYLYRIRPMPMLERIFLASIGVALVVAPLAYSLAIYYYAYTRYGPVAAQAWSQPWLFLGGWMLLAWILFLIVRLLPRRYRFRLQADRVVICPPIGRERPYRWAELSGIASGPVVVQFFSKQIFTRQQASLYLVNGGVISLPDNLENLPELLTRLKANLYPRRMPEYRAALRDGRWLWFGPLALHRQAGLVRKSLVRSGPPIPWAEVQHVTISDGRLVVESGRGRWKISVGKLPNLELFLQLVREEV